MLVYGDRPKVRAPRTLVEDLAAGLLQAERAHGAAQHDRLIHVFVEAATLAQGVIDAEYEARGCDEITPLHRAAMGMLLELARSFSTGRPAVRPFEALSAMPLPEQVTVNVQEGFAHYALYPEAYQRAAERTEWRGPPFVIGLRSIGTGLAAVVAAAAGSGADDVATVRPVGPPFSRGLRVSPALMERLTQWRGDFAIVDEGPGLSGSSMGCVGDLLEDLGVDPSRAIYFPSHGGDLGLQSSSRHRRRWASARRSVATLDDLLEANPLETWFKDLIGETLQVEDLSAGAWRDLLGEHAAPANPRHERRKFRLTSAAGVWVAKFVGLGASGRAKLDRARKLHMAGFIPEPIAVRGGFLLQRWAIGTSLQRGDYDRGCFLRHMARYLAFRARFLPAEPDDGASVQALCEMVRVNCGGLIAPPLPAIARPVHVDGKLQPWEWLELADGSFCKLDAIDHSCAHDLIGCQDIGWDVAGAAVEFGLSQRETQDLIAGIVANGGPCVSEPALRFFQTCYAAFHRGVWALAEPAAGAWERQRFYEDRLASPAESEPFGEVGHDREPHSVQGRAPT